METYMWCWHSMKYYRTFLSLVAALQFRKFYSQSFHLFAVNEEEARHFCFYFPNLWKMSTTNFKEIPEELSGMALFILVERHSSVFHKQWKFVNDRSPGIGNPCTKVINEPYVAR